ncbi:alpha/beta fold hydrolase [Salinimicrobium soli]|uniref:alpha/beta fold hydrolase n=1 Tax=Salinimicrobium soli TaxID=1254399 RepID=UPI003AADADC6
MNAIRVIKTGILLTVFLSFAASAQKRELKNQTIEIEGKPVNVVTSIPQDTRENLPVVIFQSGAGTPLNNWNTVAREVADFAPVLLYDRPGIGRSEMLDEPPTPERITEHLNKLLSELKIEPPYVLVGHSWGGPLINSFAVKYPDQVVGMVFVDETDIINYKATQIKALQRLGVGEDKYDVIEKTLMKYYENSPPGIKAEHEVITQLTEDDIDLERFSPGINVPTAYILAAKMQELPPDFPEVEIDIEKWLEHSVDIRLNNFMAKIKNNTEATLVVASHAAHYVHEDDPNLVIEAIKRVTFPQIGNQLIVAFENSGEKGMYEKYNHLKSYYPEKIFNEELLNSLGYTLLRAGKMEEAIAVFKLNTLQYPNEANPYDSLGDAHVAVGDLKKAEDLYKKATDIADQQDHPDKDLYKSKYQKIKNQQKN